MMYLSSLTDHGAHGKHCWAAHRTASDIASDFVCNEISPPQARGSDFYCSFKTCNK